MTHKLWILRPAMWQGGAEWMTITLLRELERQVFDLSLVLVRREGVLLSEVPEDVSVIGLGARNLWTCVLPLVRLLRQERPDVIFSPGGTNVPLIMAKILAQVPVCIVVSERSVLIHPALTLKRRLINRLARFLYRWADGIMAVSEGVKQDMIKQFGLAPERVDVLYNPIVDGRITELAQESVEHSWFAEDIPIILGVGRLVPPKNYPMLIRAFAQVCQQQPARLVILGDGPLRQELLDLAQEFGVQEHVWLAGFDTNPFKYMARALIFVLSSLYEGLPGALIQAMACGTAVISTDCSHGPKEIITSSHDGILIPVDDESALAAQIAFLLAHPAQRQRLGQQAQQSAQRFRVEPLVQAYTAAFTTLLPDYAPH